MRKAGITAASLACLVLAIAAAAAAPRETDVEKTAAGDLKITPLQHATLLLQWAGKAIYVDPVGGIDYSELPKADLILITDIHGDHMNKTAVAGLKKDGTATAVVAPEPVLATLPEARKIAAGEQLSVPLPGLTLSLTAVAAYNLTRGPSAGQLFHPKGRGIGYVLAAGKTKVYISGDTECTPEIKALGEIDIAFICMNLPYTMTPQEAAECIKAFRPRIVYPYHYRGQDLQQLAGALKGEKGIEVRLRNWY